jgi:hypothetical protein
VDHRAAQQVQLRDSFYADGGSGSYAASHAKFIIRQRPAMLHEGKVIALPVASRASRMIRDVPTT